MNFKSFQDTHVFSGYHTGRGLTLTPSYVLFRFRAGMKYERLLQNVSMFGIINEILLKIMPWEGFIKPNNKMDWKQLKEFCNSLDEKQLERKVVLWREEEIVNDIVAQTLEADHYIGEDEEGCYTLADAGIGIEDVEERELKKVYENGSPVLWEEF